MPHADCDFCDRDRMMQYIPGDVRCDRWVYEDKHSFAVLDPCQYTLGHTLLISKSDATDLSGQGVQEAMWKTEYQCFADAIPKVMTLLRNSARYEGQKPDRIYVCSLCDGTEHLHVHLIPRYPFTTHDDSVYRDYFYRRDGVEKVEKHIEKRHLGGFWFVAERERNWKGSFFGMKKIKERAEFLECLAKKIRS